MSDEYEHRVRREAREQAARIVAAYTDEQRAALVRHGYRPDLPPRGVTGNGPGETVVGFYDIELRNHVCKLDGILIDGHEPGEWDPACLHCTAEPDEIARDIELYWGEWGRGPRG